MKPRHFLSLIAAGIIIVFIQGCSGIKVSQDYKPSTDFKHLKTYAWKSETQKNSGDIRIDNPLLIERIRNATDTTLNSMGYRKTTGTPDFLVSYQYSIRSKIKSNSTGSSIGFGFGTYGRRGAIGVSSGTEISEYDEGMLVIDLWDSADSALLWRGTSTSRMDIHSSPEKTTKRINSIVEKILKQFPPEP